MRIINTLKNILFGFFGQILLVLMGFVSRSVFIHYLSIEYMGLNGLFSSLVQIILLVELGFSSVVQFSLYKPVAENNYDKVTRLMNYYKRMYKNIFLLIVFIGLLTVPFLHNLIKDMPNIQNIHILYLLYLLNSALSYLYSHKKFLLYAYQKNYIYISISSGLRILLFIFQMVALILFESYMLYTFSSIIVTLLECLLVNNYVNRNYIFLNDKNKKISEIDKKFLLRKTKAMFVHKLGSVLVFGTDNLIISATLGLKSIGLYSNYSMIISYLSQFIDVIFQGIRSSVGNYNATESINSQYKLYKTTFFLNYIIYSYVTIMFVICIPSFISFWIGSKYSFDTFLVLCIALSFFLSGMRNVTTIFNDVSGNFEIGRWMSIPESIINFVVSICLVSYLGIAGVVIGTIVSTLFCPYIVEPYKLYKNVFNKNQSEYYRIMFKYTLTTIFIGIFLYFVTNDIYLLNDFVSFIIIGIIGTSIFIFLNYILYKNTDEFKYIKEKILNIKMFSRGG